MAIQLTTKLPIQHAIWSEEISLMSVIFSYKFWTKPHDSGTCGCPRYEQLFGSHAKCKYLSPILVCNSKSVLATSDLLPLIMSHISKKKKKKKKKTRKDAINKENQKCSIKNFTCVTLKCYEVDAKWSFVFNGWDILIMWLIWQENVSEKGASLIDWLID